MGNSNDTFEHYNPEIYHLDIQTNTITKLSDDISAAYGSLTIPYDGLPQNSIHRWKLKIAKLGLKHKFTIGIDTACSDNSHHAIKYGYQFIEGTMVNKDDIIDIELDLYQGIIRIFVSNILQNSTLRKQMQKEYTIKASEFEYYMAVQIESRDDAISLLSHKEEKIKGSSQPQSAEMHQNDINNNKSSPSSSAVTITSNSSNQFDITMTNDTMHKTMDAVQNKDGIIDKIYEPAMENNKQYDNEIVMSSFEPHLSQQQALNLCVGDIIDHRDQFGQFVYATIIKKAGTILKIHYIGWSTKWDTWSDFTKEIYRFATAGSISKRPAHRFHHLQKGDYIDLNPIQRHPGWTCGGIQRLDGKSGQIQVNYQYEGKQYSYWTHLDNPQEIAASNTHCGANDESQINDEQKNNNYCTLTQQQALELCVGDEIDHRDKFGQFAFAKVIQKQGTNLKIHYIGWSHKWDTWSDFGKEIHRFAAAGAISKRPAHRFCELQKGDYIDINPIHKHQGWKCGKIATLDVKSGQVQVLYECLGKIYRYWTHLDNIEEITQHKSESDIFHNTTQLQQQQAQKQQRDYFKYYDKNIYSGTDHVITKIAKKLSFTAYGSMIAGNEQLVHHWKLKIVKLKHFEQQCYIGIHRVDMRYITKTHRIFRDSLNYCYGSTGTKYKISNNKKRRKSQKYSNRYCEGDIIEIQFNAQTLSLGFGLNGSRIKEAFQIQPEAACTGYCLAVNMSNINDAIEILSYTSTNANVVNQQEVNPIQLPSQSNFINVNDVDKFKYYDESLYKISDNAKTITKLKGSAGTVYGPNVATYGSMATHQWKVKILRMENKKWQTFIGMHISKNAKVLQSKNYKMRDQIHYALGSHGRIFNVNSKKTIKFGMQYRYREGDIVNIVLDLKTRIMGFGVNQFPIVRAYNIDFTQTGYCLAVFLPSPNDSVSILSHHISYKDIENKNVSESISASQSIYSSEETQLNEQPTIQSYDECLQDKQSKLQIRKLEEQNKSLTQLLNESLTTSKHLDVKLRELERDKLNQQQQTAEMKRKMNILQNELKKTQEISNRLQSEVDELNVVPNKLNALDLKQLNRLEAKFQNGITNVQQARIRWMERTYSCIVCMENERNIVTNGCNHLVLCDQCEKQLESKLCPICQTAYTKATKIKF